MKFLQFVALLLAGATPTFAHDMWVATPTFTVAEGRPATIALRVGHADESEPWNAPWERIHSFRSYGPRGVEDQQARLLVPPPEGAPNAVVTLKGPGTHIVALESYHSTSTLPADKFNEYVETEGLEAIKHFRASTGTSGKLGTEIYSRRAKLLMQVGRGTTDNVLRPIGQTLEIVPLRNPYARGTDTALPVRVLFLGRPLDGAQVRLLPLGKKADKVLKLRSDADGRVTFDVPNRGAWLIMVVHGRPMTGNPTADFDTIFASLTFGYGDGAQQ